MLWRSAPASPCGPLPPAPFHGRYAVGLCPQLSFQAVGLSFPLPLGKNMHGRIRRKRFWTGLRKAVGKSVSTAETAATESAGVIPPPTRSRLSERSVSIAGAASRESPPVPPFSAGTAAMGSAAEPEPASAVSDEVSTAPAASCGAAASACDPSCEAFGPAALGFAASESTDDPP